MSASGRLTISSLNVRPVHVPMRIPLQTSSGTIRVAPLALLDLHTSEGVTGRTYLFCYTPLVLKPVCDLLTNLEPILQGLALAPLELSRDSSLPVSPARRKGDRGHGAGGDRHGCLGRAGASSGSTSGARTRRRRARDRRLQQLRAWPDRRLTLRRRRRNHWSLQASPRSRFVSATPPLETDIKVVRAVKSAIGDGVHLMSDYNQALSVPDAVHRVRALADEGLYWIEEPCLAHDYQGYARVRAASRCPIQMGENWWGPDEMAMSLGVGASDLGMPDAMKIGGVTGWMQAAALADSAGMPISTHLFPEVSVHLMAATPTRHWLEFVDWASPDPGAAHGDQEREGVHPRCTRNRDRVGRSRS